MTTLRSSPTTDEMGRGDNAPGAIYEARGTFDDFHVTAEVLHAVERRVVTAIRDGGRIRAAEQRYGTTISTPGPFAMEGGPPLKPHRPLRSPQSRGSGGVSGVAGESHDDRAVDTHDG